jgi:O-antigen/teichoic acid export membrane protein
MSSNGTRKNASILVGAKLIEKALGLVALVIYARTFETTELALVPVTFLLGSIVLVIFGFGILPTIVMEVPRLIVSNRARAISLIRHALLIGAFGSCMAGILVLAGSRYLAKWLADIPDLNSTIHWVAAAVVFQSLLTLLIQILSGLTKFWAVASVNLVASVARLSVVPLLYHLYGTDGIVAGLAIASVMGCVIALFLIWRDCRHTGAEQYGFLEILRLSWPFYAEGYVMYLRSQGDQLIVSLFLGAEALAFYFIARRPYDLLKVISDSIDFAVIPALSKLSLETRAAFAVRWHELFRAFMSISFPLAFLTAACVPLYLAIIGAQKFAAALAPAMILCLAFTADMAKVIVIRSVFVLGRPLRRLQCTTFESATMIASLLIAAPVFGPSGVASAYLLASIAGVWFGYRMLRREITTTHPWRHGLRAAIPAIVAFCGMIAVLMLTRSALGDSMIATLLGTLAGVVVFVLLNINIARTEVLRAAMDAVGIRETSLASRAVHSLRLRAI